MTVQGVKASLTDLTLPRSRELEERARRVGLDPATCTLFQICCAEQHLDPASCTCLDLATAKLGKAPGELTEAEVRDRLGKHWVTKVVE